MVVRWLFCAISIVLRGWLSPVPLLETYWMTAETRIVPLQTGDTSRSLAASSNAALSSDTIDAERTR